MPAFAESAAQMFAFVIMVMMMMVIGVIMRTNMRI
jgi:hypothetical protein